MTGAEAEGLLSGGRPAGLGAGTRAWRSHLTTRALGIGQRNLFNQEKTPQQWYLRKSS